jgi:hypothetical protein
MNTHLLRQYWRELVKVGDLVKVTRGLSTEHDVGIVVKIDNRNRQTIADVLLSKGLMERVWDGHINIISEENIEKLGNKTEYKYDSA